jgi:hypothetical protein
MRIFLVLILLISINVNSQSKGTDKIDVSNLSPWVSENIDDYIGAYYFGISESESELRIYISDNLICAQLMTYHWNEKLNGFIEKYENLKNVRIIENKFYSDKSNGEFVECRTENGFSVGLLVDNPWSYENQIEKELGSRLPDKDVYLVGDFANASKKLIKEKDLQDLNLSELKIMRNEIFARYNYKFKSGGKMDKYFSKKDWYNGVNENVDNCLTDIEKQNIRLTQKIENKKNSL